MIPQGIKIVEEWYMPEKETSTLKKIYSTRAKLNQPEFPIGDYQIGLREAALKYVKKFDGVVDAGAHIGLWSVPLSKFFKQVHAFEINPDVQPCLDLNLQSREIKNVLTYHVGLGDKENLVCLSPTKNKSMGTHVVAGAVGIIPVKPLDFFNIENVDLVKIDVEGFEPFVLLGAEKTIKSCKPIIIMEDKQLHEAHSNALNPNDILKSFGMIELERMRKDVIYGWKN